MALWLVVFVVCVWSIPVAYAEERVRVALDVRNGVVTKPSVVAGALREAAAIWAPYGVIVETAARVVRGGGTSEITVVPVTLESVRPRGHRNPLATPLGWTGFERNGAPAMRISIFFDAIRFAATNGLFGYRAVHASPVLEERIVARVLGRTLAHELGHVVLRTPDHSRAGLMRAAQSIDELQHPSGMGFTLEESDLARLQRVLSSSTLVTPNLSQ